VNNLIFFISISAITVVGTIVWLAIQMLNYRQKYLKVQQARLDNTGVDLELATWDQLWTEIRTRREHSYILLKPELDTPGQVTLALEIHNVPPIPACGVLKVASEMQLKQLGSTPQGREFLAHIERLKEEGFSGLPPWLESED
jgi:hypothetical protein